MGTGENTLNIIAVEGERFLITGGTTISNNTSAEIDFFAYCLDGNVDLVWDYYLPPSGTGLGTFPGFYDAILEVDDGYLMLCFQKPNTSSDQDMMLLKLDKITGEQIWLKEYNTPSYEIGNTLIELEDGCLLIAGETRNNIDLSSINNVDAFLMKTDSAGTIIWSRTYDSGNLWEDEAKWLVSTSDGGFALGCYTDPSSNGSFEGYLIKTDSLGYTEWEFSHPAEGFSPIVRIAPNLSLTIDGNLLLLSEWRNDETGIDQMQLREFSLSGDTLAINDLGGGAYRRTPNMVALPDGNYLSFTLSNTTNRLIQEEMEELTSINDRPLTFSKHTKEGDIIWDHYYHVLDADITVADICYVPWDGGFAATGFYVQEEAAPEDPNSFILKLDENGCLDPENCGLYMWVIGDEVIDQTHLLSVGIDDLELLEVKLYPNPTTDKLTIKLAENGIAAHYLIHDLEGKQVMHSGKVANGISELELDVSQYSSGIYILKLISDQGLVLGGRRFVKE